MTEVILDKIFKILFLSIQSFLGLFWLVCLIHFLQIITQHQYMTNIIRITFEKA